MRALLCLVGIGLLAAAYPAGMLEGARLLDAPPHHVTAEETIRTCKDYELLVLFTSTPGFPGDIRLAQAEGPDQRGQGQGG